MVTNAEFLEFILDGGYQLMINATPLNSHGVGVLNDGSTQFHQFVAGAVDPNNANSVPVAFQPNYEGLVQSSTLLGGASGSLTGNGQASYLPAAPGTLGDSDEPYDAADYQNMFLSYTESQASLPLHVIPSFHRAALITYIVNWKDPATWTEQEFLWTLRRLQLAMIRPVSFNFTIPSGSFSSHPEFTGSNASSMRLEFNLGTWGSWPSTGWPIFQTWLNHLTQGPWDVDADGDGLTDSVWVDPGLALQTTSEGKLVQFIPVPTDMITNCAFGDEDLKTLYITAGHKLWSIACCQTSITGRICIYTNAPGGGSSAFY